MGNALASFSTDLLTKIDMADAEGVKALLINNQHLKNPENKKQILNQSLLFHSCVLGCRSEESDRKREARLRIINMLIEAGMDIQSVDEEGQNVLHEVVSHKDCTELVAALISHGIKVNLKDKQGITPLFHACSNGDRATLLYLLDHGADSNEADSRGNTPLHAAILRNDDEQAEVVRILLDHGSKIDKANKKGFTPLLYCFTYEGIQEDTVVLLLERGASVPTTFTKKKSADKKRPDNINKDLYYSPDQEAASTMAVLHEAIVNTRLGLRTVEMLVKRGCKVNATRKDEPAPLAAALLAGKTQVVDFLLTQGADIPTAETSLRKMMMAEGWTASYCFLLTTAVQCGMLDFVKLLVEKYRADTHFVHPLTGCTYLHAAITSRNTELLRYLLEKGDLKRNINTCDKSYESPLQWSLRSGNVEAAKVLLEFGADLTKCKDSVKEHLSKLKQNSSIPKEAILELESALTVVPVANERKS